MTKDTLRLSKRIARSGIYSRHEADRLISLGKVLFNGEVALPGLQVPLQSGEIIVDGKLLEEAEPSVYKFNKPVGVLSSYFDPNGKKNLSSFIELSGVRLGYSGRLDYNSQGLMLFSSDGDLIQSLQKSEFKVEKEYVVTVDKDITDEWIRRLMKGIRDKEEQFLPCDVKRLSLKKYRVILIEGKKHQVRRMFKAAGANVQILERVRIGTVTLGHLSPGRLVPLSKAEIKTLREAIHKNPAKHYKP